ncbi:Der GTPase-activating protein YihI [Pectobacteriaceae bacterium CE70]|uniref:Der GTPase-activating protein YihI n=1 Tax=Serratia sp. (strain ATCC 39006) TaxID=104623 RepID=A0A2I5TCS3_SERS3|nr:MULTISPECIES: Der GTPase-activating protein YihI [Enterobacterales]WJV62604.1 Der GTPase-activating protein YihI [Pectobacteriaceae bacterium C52]WJV66926.1 Der GTPase-activating protein YihI [Pectobacteriaceae bacterium CE70]WJY10915.1 Der GTPase-activating protein YihI [Pectobacteriaceae bacterium C80]AUH02378.1 Der GTPase-activating protein YihI [Serratia sp. ATCC 39006]AUH06700.1 Der GTPase-activating protein YihI [Serratia sp. ATCC 39006]
MKQPVKGPGDKSTKPKIKRKSREELNIEARERKRQKKHRGHTSGNRTQEGSNASKSSGQSKIVDPRIGSKKPVSLIANTAAPMKVVAPKAEKLEKLSPEEELGMLENDSRLDDLLDRLEKGETLSAKDQSWVDEKLDRIDILMELLGIELGDDDEEEPEEDMLQLLKRNNPKDN